MRARLTLALLVAFSVSFAGAAQARGANPLYGYPQTGLSWQILAFELGPWDEYLLHELTPELASLPRVPLPRVSWLHLDSQLILPDFASDLMGETRSALVFSLIGQSAALPLREISQPGSETLGFEQSLLLSGITHRVSDQSAVTVSAVLASQRYGATGMNLNESDTLYAADHDFLRHPYLRPEVVHGAGVRLALSSEIFERLLFEAAFQSRIGMAELASLRGVHGSQAEFDIPSRIQVGLQFNATSRASFNVGISQINYSEVGAFPSRALPARFTALLGDSTSPQFEWEDLLVYSVGWQWQNRDDLAIYLDYRTRSQPRPSSAALSSALEPELAQNAVLAGFRKGLGERMRFELSAAYAPPEFAFGGNVLGVVSDQLDQEIEVQATWRMDF
jgi:hypothetical protein